MRMYSAHHRVKLNMNMKGGPKIVEDDIYFAGLGVCWRRLCHPIPDSQYQFPMLVAKTEPWIIQLRRYACVQPAVFVSHSCNTYMFNNTRE